jgi:TolA-binding protein
LLTTHITDETAIVEAMKGYYTGYSPSILSRASADKYLEALKANKECACKNVSSMGNSLIKDVPDPVVLSVSLTKQPCLHESKFCELNGEIMEDEVSLKSKILTAIGMTEEAEVIALKAEIKDLDAKIEAMQNEFNKSLEKLQADFKQILTDALKPVEEEPAEEEAEPEKEEVAEKAETETTEDAEVEVEEEVEEPVAEEATEEEATEEPVAEKGESKAEPVHDNIVAEKSKPKSVYELMGRYPNGVKIRR